MTDAHSMDLKRCCSSARADSDDGGFCPRFHHAVELVGRRWSGVILRAMLQGASRFTDIRAAVPELSDKMLAERLKEFEAEGVVRRTVVPETPVRVEYGLTEKGRALDGAVAALAAWADAWLPTADAPADAPADATAEAPDARAGSRPESTSRV